MCIHLSDRVLHKPLLAASGLIHSAYFHYIGTHFLFKPFCIDINNALAFVFPIPIYSQNSCIFSNAFSIRFPPLVFLHQL